VVTLNLYLQISETIRGNLIAKIIFRHPLLHKLEFATDTPLAGEIGLDEKEIQLCIDSGRYEDRIQEDFTNGGESGVSGTPGTILLNNKTGRAKIKSGALPFKALKIEIDQLLEG
jgi:protein-disulfide isomerase